MSSLGECITSAKNDSVCDLNSVAVQCDNLTATQCSCHVGYELSTDSALNCVGMLLRLGQHHCFLSLVVYNLHV